MVSPAPGAASRSSSSSRAVSTKRQQRPAVSKACSQTHVFDKASEPLVVNFGPERSRPPTTWMGKLGVRLVHFEDIQNKYQGLGVASQPTIGPSPNRIASMTQQQHLRPQKDRPAGSPKPVELVNGDDDKNGVAAINMADKTAGADNLAEYADMINEIQLSWQ